MLPRRNFLKLLGLSPIVPSVLMAKDAVDTEWTHQEILGAVTHKGVEFKPAMSEEEYQRKMRAVVIKSYREANEKTVKLKLKPELQKIPGAKEWLKECEDIINEDVKGLSATEMCNMALEKVNFPKKFIK